MQKKTAPALQTVIDIRGKAPYKPHEKVPNRSLDADLLVFGGL